VAYSRGYLPTTKPLSMPSGLFVLESAEALSDAARAGVIHGDLRPERFLISGEHVLIEGFGIPWVSGPSSYAPPEGIANYAGDVYAFGRVMQELAPDLPVPVKTLLDRCVTRKPEDRPSAAQLLTALVALQRPPQEKAPEPVKSVAQPQTAFQAPSTTQTGSQQTLEIDFTVSEPDPPAPSVVMPPVNVPGKAPVAGAGTLPDMPDLDLFPEESSTPSFASKNFNSAKNFNTDFGAGDFDMPAPPVKRSLPQDNWDDDEHDMLLETDPGQVNPKANVVNPTKSSSSLPAKSSGKLPEAGPKRPGSKNIDPKQTFIKDLPPGATYKAGKSTDAAPAPFKETPVAPTFDEVFLKGNTSSKNTRRIVMVIALLLFALIFAGLAFFGTDGITGEPTTGTTTTANYIVSVNLDPPNLPPLDLIVVASPEGSKFRAGAVVSKVPGQIVLDRAGTWQFQGRFQDKLSETVTLQAPEQYNLTITMPDILPPVETPETPTEGEVVEPTTPDDANP
jgi:serine/threonine protein kinase